MSDIDNERLASIRSEDELENEDDEVKMAFTVDDVRDVGSAPEAGAVLDDADDEPNYA